MDPPPSSPQPSNAKIVAVLTQQATANQKRIEEKLNNHTTCLDARASSLPQHSLLTSLNHRQLSLQRLQLKNPDKKFYTRFSDIPSELARLILAWIHPKQVWKLRGLSRSFRDCISTLSFASINVHRFLPPPDPTITESVEPSEHDLMFLDNSPPSYQMCYFRSQWKYLKELYWGMTDHTFEDVEIPHPPAMQLSILFVEMKHLVQLSLVECNLEGPIPVEIGNLESLQLLNLGDNRLEGAIPSDIAKLKQLTDLSLYTNMLSGPIPAELGELLNLSGMWLTNNKLSGPLPSTFGNLSKLKIMYLGNNAFCGPIPREWCNLPSLKKLSLENNEELACSIPQELGSLTALQCLYLGSCNLFGQIPPELGQLANLEFLELGENALLSGEVPAELAALEHLSSLDVRGCPGVSCLVEFEVGVLLQGVMPEESEDEGSSEDSGEFEEEMSLNRRQVSLELLQLQNPTKKFYTRFSDLPSEVARLILSWIHPKQVWKFLLVRLSFVEFNLSGPIPDEIGNLASLEVLNLGSNRPEGEFPSSFSELKQLKMLGRLSNLEQLYLHSCNLSGEIPRELGQLLRLVELLLSGNTLLTGELPAEIAALEDLLSVDVRGCPGVSWVAEFPEGVLLQGPMPGQLEDAGDFDDENGFRSQ
ncbi:hypothetical protein HDU98_007749 [Podochytrium sp. JEL0797]|nr:hypothetical protein HDU98_007749 [Podochytrium sp. JEL0797]